MFLDVVRGTLTRVASNQAAFRTQLALFERVQEWLLPDLVAALRQNGLALDVRQGYSLVAWLGKPLRPLLNTSLAGG